MNIPFFISKRIINNKGKSFSKAIIRLATLATALSVAIMIISLAVVLGFKETIKDKMFVFWGNIQITPYNANPSSIISPNPFDYDAVLRKEIKQMPGVTSVLPYVLKPGIIQAGNIMEGIKIKGIDKDYGLQSNSAISYSGKGISFQDSGYAMQILLSETTLSRLNKKIGDSVLVYFINPQQEFPRVRRLQISGTYHTGMDEIDKNFAFSDIRLIQRISNWDEKAINGYQVAVADYKKSDEIANDIYQKYLQPPMSKNTMQDIYPTIFSWLDLMNRNTYIILIIMAVVAVINLSTALLIFILERTNMVGILKTLGMPMGEIQKIFLYHSALISLKGILWGTVVGVGFCLLQSYTHIIPLPESAYYMQYVPIKLIAWQVLAIDFGVLVFCTLILMVPIMIVRRISIINTLRFK